MLAGIAHISNLQCGVTGHLLLKGDVPLPGVWNNAACGSWLHWGKLMRWSKAGCIHGTVRVDADDEWRRSSQTSR